MSKTKVVAELKSLQKDTSANGVSKMADCLEKMVKNGKLSVGELSNKTLLLTGALSLKICEIVARLL